MNTEDFKLRLQAYGFGRVQSFNNLMAHARSAGFEDVDALSRFIDNYVVAKRKEYINQEVREAERTSTKADLKRHKRLRRSQKSQQQIPEGNTCPHCNVEGNYIMLTRREGIDYETCATVGDGGTPEVGCGYSKMIGYYTQVGNK